MGGAVQHPLMLPVPDGLHGLRGMETGVLRLFDMANGHFMEPIGMAQFLPLPFDLPMQGVRTPARLSWLTAFPDRKNSVGSARFPAE